MESDRRVAEDRRVIVIQQKYVPKILAMGLMLSAILIIFSVESFYREGKYLELAVSTGLFIAMLIMIRRLNFAHTK